MILPGLRNKALMISTLPENDSKYLPANFVAEQRPKPSSNERNPRKPRLLRKVLTESSIGSLPHPIVQRLESDSEMEIAMTAQSSGQDRLKGAMEDESNRTAKSAPVSEKRPERRKKGASESTRNGKDRSTRIRRQQKDKNVKLASKVMEVL